MSEALLGIHVLASLLYGLVDIKNTTQERICKVIFVLFFPGFGLLFFFILWLLEKAFNVQEEIDYSDLISKHERSGRFIKEVDFMKEINVVSLEEALIVNENKTKRRIVLDALKEKADMYIDHLNLAIYDEDTETSHYAASGLMNLKRKFDLSLQEMALRYEKEHNDYETASAYATILGNYLKSGLIEEVHEKKYQSVYLDVLTNLVDQNETEKIEEQYFMELINCALDLQEYERAERYCEQYLARYSDSENAYLVYIKLYFRQNRREKMFDMMQKMQHSLTTVSKEAKNIIAFWTGGVS
ncbi:MAG: hypothetical protein MJB12_12170 [Firmicutes bacterium]|nr:hypothetical protein [Bacillota bacterium]